jgi:hypothetical protein
VQFDALLKGEIRKVKSDRLGEKHRNKPGLYTFHSRKFLPAHAREVEKERDQLFEKKNGAKVSIHVWFLRWLRGSSNPH